MPLAPLGSSTLHRQGGGTARPATAPGATWLLEPAASKAAGLSARAQPHPWPGRQWTIREVLQGRELPRTNEEARVRMGSTPTKWYAATSKTSGLSLRPAGAPEASLSARPRPRLPQAPSSLGQSTSRAALAGHIVLGLRPRYVKLMRRMQIKKMTFKERRKLWTYNGKKNKLGKETARWK